ncbi:MAG TPA: PqqD family protein [Pyrinomonadaceae bacterium]|nr:PqqD family protein [Pyrinomonadaceae bacterium]HMP64918.1 PqqD family protein [Pyrinomonadaceae bacterium]
MNNPQFPIARSAGLVVQDVPDEVLVYDTEKNKAHCLNRTAALVWRSCDGKTSVSELAKIVGDQAGEEISDEIVWLALDQLSKTDLLEREHRLETFGRSRREALKKIGLASMVALPIVASLAAPQSALANLSCACTTVADCSGPGVSCPTAGCSGEGVCI